MKRGSLFTEFIRKTLHLSGLLVVVGYTLLLNYFSPRMAILILTGVLLVILEIEYIRLEHKPKVKVLDQFAAVFRNHEKNQLTAPVFFLISSIIAFAAFEYWIAVLAIFMTVFGDLFAALVGKTFKGRKLYKRKTFIGTLAGFMVNLLIGFLILPEFPIVFVPVALSATLVEVFTTKMDDNLTVPLFSGFIGQIIVYYSGFDLPPIDFTFLGFF